MGDMTEGGGLAAAFDNVASQTGANSSKKTVSSVQTLMTDGGIPGNLTSRGGFGAAFDGDTDQTLAESASSAVLSWPAICWIGMDHGAGVTKKVTSFTVYGPNNIYICYAVSPTTFDLELHGSSSPLFASYTVLYSSTGIARSYSQVISVNSGIDTSTAYRCHRIAIKPSSQPPSGGYYTTVAELQFYETVLDAAAHVGKDWGSGALRTIAAFTAYPSSDRGFLSNGGSVDIKLQGSMDNFASSIVDLYSATNQAGGSMISVSSGISTSVAYRCHRLYITPSSTPAPGDYLSVAELQLMSNDGTWGARFLVRIGDQESPGKFRVLYCSLQMTQIFCRSRGQ